MEKTGICKHCDKLIYTHYHYTDVWFHDATGNGFCILVPHIDAHKTFAEPIEEEIEWW